MMIAAATTASSLNKKMIITIGILVLLEGGLLVSSTTASPQNPAKTDACRTPGGKDDGHCAASVVPEEKDQQEGEQFASLIQLRGGGTGAGDAAVQAATTGQKKQGPGDPCTAGDSSGKACGPPSNGQFCNFDHCPTGECHLEQDESAGHCETCEATMDCRNQGLPDPNGVNDCLRCQAEVAELGGVALSPTPAPTVNQVPVASCTNPTGEQIPGIGVIDCVDLQHWRLKEGGMTIDHPTTEDSLNACESWSGGGGNWHKDCFKKCDDKRTPEEEECFGCYHDVENTVC